MAKLKFRPLHDRVVVKRIDADDKSKGGIIIPDTAKEKPMQGEVVAVGPGGRDEAGKLVPIELKAGDKVLFWQVVGHRSETRRRGTPDHEGVRHHGRARLISPTGDPQWLPKKLDFQATPVTECCAASTSSPPQCA